MSQHTRLSMHPPPRSAVDQDPAYSNRISSQYPQDDDDDFYQEPDPRFRHSTAESSPSPSEVQHHAVPQPRQSFARPHSQYPEIVGDDPDPFYNGTNNQPYQQQPAPSPRPPSRAQTNGIPPSPPPLLDHSHLRPGKQAALLSHERTLELYRANAKKSNDPEIQFDFAVFMIDAAKGIPIPSLAHGNQLEIERITERKEELIREATNLLKKLADRGHPPSQYFLADCYANGIGTFRNRQDFDRAFPLFVLAAKHNHPDAAYRAGTCLENGWGCRREAAKAVQFYRKAAVALHPGAMYRLGISELNGELGLSKRPKEGVKWLKRSAEHATPEFPHALHELALLHERGIDNVVFVDYEYSLELLAQAAELGYAPSAHRLGECYEYGKMGCPQDPALSIHYYNIAAQQSHRDACFALTAWYLVGSPGVLPQSDTEAYLWAKRAAEQGLAKAMYAVGYFTEVGIGTVQSMPDASQWYKRAAEAGDKRAMQRLKNAAQGPLPGAPVDRSMNGSMGTASTGGKKDKDKDCVIM